MKNALPLLILTALVGNVQAVDNKTEQASSQGVQAVDSDVKAMMVDLKHDLEKKQASLKEKTQEIEDLQYQRNRAVTGNTNAMGGNQDLVKTLKNKISRLEDAMKEATAEQNRMKQDVITAQKALNALKQSVQNNKAQKALAANAYVHGVDPKKHAVESQTHNILASYLTDAEKVKLRQLNKKTSKRYNVSFLNQDPQNNSMSWGKQRNDDTWGVWLQCENKAMNHLVLDKPRGPFQGQGEDMKKIGRITVHNTQGCPTPVTGDYTDIDITIIDYSTQENSPVYDLQDLTAKTVHITGPNNITVETMPITKKLSMTSQKPGGMLRLNDVQLSFWEPETQQLRKVHGIPVTVKGMADYDQWEKPFWVDYLPQLSITNNGTDRTVKAQGDTVSIKDPTAQKIQSYPDLTRLATIQPSGKASGTIDCLTVTARANQLYSQFPITTFEFTPNDSHRPSQISIPTYPQNMNIVANVNKADDKILQFVPSDLDHKKYSLQEVADHLQQANPGTTYTMTEKVIGINQCTTFTNKKAEKPQEEEAKE